MFLACGRDAETAAAGDAIRFEVVVVDRKDRRHQLTSGEMDQSCVSKIHRAIVVLRHEGFRSPAYRHHRSPARAPRPNAETSMRRLSRTECPRRDETAP